MGRLMGRRRTLSAGLGRRMWLSAGLVALVLAGASLPHPAGRLLREGIRFVLTADYDPAPALRWLADLTRPAPDGAPGPQAPEATIPVAAAPARGNGLRAPVLLRPVPPGPVLSGYGWRTGRDGRQEFHAGVDLAARQGEPVRAAATGVVKAVGEEPAGYGRYVILDHGEGWETLYAHNDRILVAAGRQVRRGQAIARAGRTGNATAPHVHLEVRLAGSPVDPLPYLGLARE